MTDPQNHSFQDAAQGPSQGLIREFTGFMSENAKWWLTPFLCVFGILGVALIAGGGGAAPFIYSMF